MTALSLALGLAAPAFLVVLVVSLWRTARATLPQRSSDPVYRAAQRRTAGATAAGGLVVVALALLPWRTPSGNPLVAAVTVLAIGVVMVVTATVVELTWPRPRGAVRVAVARPRPEVAPGLRRLRTAGAVTLVGLCLLTAVLGAVEGVDRGTRMPQVMAFPLLSGGLFPGWPYGLALLVTLAALTAVTTWGLRVVEARPALDEGHAGLDAAARVTSTARLLRTAACTTWLTVLGVAFVAGSSLHELAQGLRGAGSPEAHVPPFDWRQDLAFGLFALGLLAGVLALAAALSRATPAPATASGPAVAGTRGRTATDAGGPTGAASAGAPR